MNEGRRKPWLAQPAPVIRFFPVPDIAVQAAVDAAMELIIGG